VIGLANSGWMLVVVAQSLWAQTQKTSLNPYHAIGTLRYRQNLTFTYQVT
jgi:hypothetical protein